MSASFVDLQECMAPIAFNISFIAVRIIPLAVRNGQSHANNRAASMFADFLAGLSSTYG